VLHIDCTVAVMDTITTFAPRATADRTYVLPSYFPVPMLGLVPVNAYFIDAKEPVLIDTGLFAASNEFMMNLRSIVPLDSLRWIWLTHMDNDHIGSLERLLVAAPRARVVTTFLGMGKYSLRGALPPDRVHLLNPGQALSVGDRKLHALRPPTYDAPETTALFDERTRTLFSSDSFGAVLQDPAEDAAAIPHARLREGSVLWSSIDSPWLENIRLDTFGRTVADIRALNPEWILSSHLPPAHKMMDALADNLLAAAGGKPFVGPDQAALLAAMGAPPPRASVHSVV
jgi:glyoxylase-like metal-dependent hydrolase (beta-lactamase superfamily II)